MKILKKFWSIFFVAIFVLGSITVVKAEGGISLQGGDYDGYHYRFEIKGLSSSYTWNGKAIEPDITVEEYKSQIVDDNSLESTDVEKDVVTTLKENEDYTLHYENNYKVGKAKVVVEGQGKYQGTLSKEFSIVQNKVNITVSNITKTSANIKFTPIQGISKYALEVKGVKTYTNAKANQNYAFTLKTGTSYTVQVKAYAKDQYDQEYSYIVGTKTLTTLYNVGKVTISSVKAGNEMAQVNWKAVSGAPGYEIYRSTSSTTGFTKIKTVSAKTTSYTNFLLGVRTYYYKVRAYKTVNGKTSYGPYSTVKSCKVKASTRYTYYLRANIRTNVTTVYAKDFNGKYVAVKALTTSCGVYGKTKPILGTHYTKAKYRWKYMQENCYTQYATRITGHYLFHSIPYSKAKPNTLWYNSYNKLGNFASAGCVRLRCIDAKWIYDHCPLKTKTVVVYSKTDPLKKQSIPRINTKSKNRVWDPSDPDKNNPWKK